MLISIPVTTSVTTTDVSDSTPIYDATATYVDKDLVQYDPTGLTDYSIYGVFTDALVETVAPHHYFVYYSAISPYAVVDTKNYSKATRLDSMSYTVLGAGRFDTLALGSILGSTVSAYFTDISGTVVYSIIDREITNKIDTDGRHDAQPVTEILYCPVDLEHGSTVSIEITCCAGKTVELGTILLGLSLDAGFTNLVFTNKFKDFSPTETDQWGNVEYIPGLKVNVHTGSVDIPITHYDFLNRTMLAIGGNEVILNGYGVKNNAKPDNAEGHFYATMMIGRMKNFSLATSLDNKRLGELATYKIELEEVV